MIIKKEFTIDLAHRLQQHQWKCFNVHWHTYKIILYFEWDLKEDWPETGMVKDFGNIKPIIQRFQDNRDHCYLYNTGDVVGEFIKSQWMRIWECDFELTAENMSIFIVNKFKDQGVCAAEVYETPTSSAIFTLNK